MPLTITISDGGLGLLAGGGSEFQAVIGCSSAGSAASILATTKISELISTYGYGPLVEAAAVSLQETGKPVLAIKTPNTTPGSNSAVTQTGTGTSVVTLTGTPVDTYDGILKVVTGGTIGTTGCVIKYTLDGGETYSADIALGTANSYAIPNSGITLNFAAGTLVAGDVYKWTSTEPLWAIADVQAAILALKNSTYSPKFIQLVGKVSAANCTTLDTEMTGLETAARFTGLLAHARDNNAGESQATWKSSLQADFLNFSSKRIGVTAGHYQINSPISGRMYRRPLSFAVAARLHKNAIGVDAGQVSDGGLAGLRSSATDGKIYHDERTSPGLDGSRFLVAQTHIGEAGFFVTNPNLMAPAGSDFVWWQYRFVIDEACRIARNVLMKFLNSSVRVNATTGFIVEKDAQDLESRLGVALRNGLVHVRPQAASSVSAVVSRVDNIISTKTINVTVRVVPLGYLKTINLDLGFRNPALGIVLS
jgi:hypothetical protein